MKTQLELLRPYQIEAGSSIFSSVEQKLGLTFSIEIARQGGKNELSSYVEALLLAIHSSESKNLIKCSPTFKPQTVTSMLRLKEKLNGFGLHKQWMSEMGYIVRLGKARVIFLSAEPRSNVVGNTAHLLLEVDEAQDVSEEKYNKEFRPMGSTTNVTAVLYGTTWDDSSLLERVKQTNLELERKDGIKRHFRFDWEEVGRHNPAYQAYVENERQRLGEDHPLFLTQYRLLPIHGGGGFLSMQQKAQLQGLHPRLHCPETGKTYVGSIDLGGEAEACEDDYLTALKSHQDSTVFTVGRLLPEALRQPGGSAGIEIVEHYNWTGRKHAELYPQLIDLIKNVWHCRSVVVDATGIGQPVASYLRQALGSRIIPFTFTAPAKTELGFNLLAAINSGILKMYAADGSEEYQEFWHQMERAKSFYRPSRTMNFFVDQDEGHDDFLMSLALLVEAARRYTPREARGS